MPINISAVLLSLVCAGYAYCQSPAAAIEHSEATILYRGYANRVNPNLVNKEAYEVRVVGTNCKVKPLGTDGTYLVSPGSGGTASLSFGYLTPDGIVPAKEIAYRVSNMPDPVLYLGGAASGGTAGIDAHELEVKFADAAVLQEDFAPEVVRWTMQIEGKTISGEGPSLSAAQSVLRGLTKETPVSMDVVVKNADGMQLKLSGKWLLDPFQGR